MKRLSQMVTIMENNENCVVLKVKKNQFANLVGLGCFNGDETMFRLTKGSDHTCTVWHGENNKHYSWNWGSSGYTLVTDKLHSQGIMVQNCIADDFGIYIGSDLSKVRQTLYKRKPQKKTEKFVAMWWQNEKSIVVHRNGEFWKGFNSENDFIEYIQGIGGKMISRSDVYRSPHTNCCMMDIMIEL